MLPTLLKHAGETRTYEVDVGPGMRAVDTIGAVGSIAVTPDGIVIDDITHTDSIVRFQAAGGESGETYRLRLRWSTEQAPTQVLEAFIALVLSTEPGEAGTELQMAFRAQFPEFDRRSSDDLARALAEARMIHDVRELVTLYWAAHLLTMGARIASGNTSATGARKKAKVGPLSTEYVALAADGDIRAEGASTAYGAHALFLERRTPRTAIGAVVAG